MYAMLEIYAPKCLTGFCFNSIFKVRSRVGIYLGKLCGWSRVNYWVIDMFGSYVADGEFPSN